MVNLKREKICERMLRERERRLIPDPGGGDDSWGIYVWAETPAGCKLEEDLAGPGKEVVELGDCRGSFVWTK